MAGGIIILTRQTKIAEMSFSDHRKIDFQFLEKSVQPKLKYFGRGDVENLKNHEILRVQGSSAAWGSTTMNPCSNSDFQ